MHVFCTKGNLDDALKGQVDRNEDDNPRNDGHGSYAVDEIEAVRHGQVHLDLIHAAGHAHCQYDGHEDAGVFQGHVHEVRNAGRPHAADQGYTDEDDSAHEHPCRRREDFRHKGGENHAAGNVLHAHDDELYDDLANDADNHALLIVIPFQHFGNRRDVEAAVFFSDGHAHDDRADAPGRRVPAGGKTGFIGLFGNADSRRAADGQADDRNHDKRRRELTAGQDIVFRLPGSAVLRVPAD